MTRYLVGDQQLRYAIHFAISTLDSNKQDKNYIIDPLFCHNCGQRFKYVDQDRLAYKHQSNRADILRTLKLKAETQPTFDLTELNQ